MRVDPCSCRIETSEPLTFILSPFVRGEAKNADAREHPIVCHPPGLSTDAREHPIVCHPPGLSNVVFFARRGFLEGGPEMAQHARVKQSPYLR
jgi:hypothetical protein